MQPVLTLNELESKLVEKYFQPNWIDQFNIIGPANPDIQPLLINNLNKVAIEIVDFVVLLLLSGEYCNLDFNKWDSSRQKFKNFIENKSFELEALQATHGAFAYKAQDYFINNIIKPFDELINPFFHISIKT